MALSSGSGRTSLAVTGMMKRKVLPMPSPWLSAQILPPWSSTSFRVNDRPNPVPLYSLPAELSTCSNVSKIRSSTPPGLIEPNLNLNFKFGQNILLPYESAPFGAYCQKSDEDLSGRPDHRSQAIRKNNPPG